MWIEGWGNLPGQLVVVSGPSGCGKSTVIRHALQHTEMNLQLSVSATTRDPRPGEQDGVDYYFMDQEKFLEKRDKQEFIESAIYNGRFYGTPAIPVFSALASNKNLILEIEVHGAKQIRAKAPSAIFVFIKTPSFRVLEERLWNRGTDNEAQMLNRLRQARMELAEAHWYDYQVVNDDLDRCVEEFVSILKSHGSGG